MLWILGVRVICSTPLPESCACFGRSMRILFFQTRLKSQWMLGGMIRKYWTFCRVSELVAWRCSIGEWVSEWVRLQLNCGCTYSPQKDVERCTDSCFNFCHVEGSRWEGLAAKSRVLKVLEPTETKTSNFVWCCLVLCCVPVCIRVVYVWCSNRKFWDLLACVWFVLSRVWALIRCVDVM